MKTKSIFITAKGGVEVLKPVETELKDPLPNEVRVKIHYCGVGFTDVIMRYGYYPYAPPIPFAPGYEIIGTVEKIGSEVSSVKVGDKVVALTVHGGYAEYLTREEDHFVKVPDGLDEKEAVCLVLNYVTAYQMLHREAETKAGDTVLITGASGGVGTALLQLGKVIGATMFGTASKSKFALVTANGGIPIDYQNEDVVQAVKAKYPAGLDAAFDGIGGSFTGICSRCLKPDGTLVAYGFTSSVKNGKADNGAALSGMARFAWAKIFKWKRTKFYGITALYRKDKAPFKADLPKLFALLKDGKIKPSIHTTLPLTQAREANLLLEQGKATGKVLLDCRLS